jgi:hypothetical protein
MPGNKPRARSGSPFTPARRVVLLALPLLLSPLLACSHASSTRGWELNRTKNVALYTDARLEHEFIQEWLELSHAAMQAFFPDVKTGTVEAVWLQAEPGSATRFYSPLDDPRAGWTLEGLPSEGRIGKNGLIVLERRLEGWTFRPVRDEDVAKEQMAHVFINRAVPMAPLWLQVGLGRYLQKFRIHYRERRETWLACFGSPWFDEPMGLGMSTGDGRRVNLGVADIFTSDWYQYDRRKRAWYEFTSYAFVHYLLHGKGMNKQRFSVMLKALRAGQSTPEALATAYPQVLPGEWDERIDEHAHTSEVHARLANERYLPQGLCFDIPAAHHADQRPTKTPVNEQDVSLLLGDLERVDPFRRHAGWWPIDIVLSEAAKRPGRPRPGPGTGPGGQPGGTPGGGDQKPRPEDGDATILRSSKAAPAAAGPSVPAPQPAAPAPAPAPELPPD